MNMQSMSVNPAQVHELSASVQNNSRQIAAELEKLEKRVTELKASWSGEAVTAYAQAQASWDKQIAEMEQLLARIGLQLAEIADGYISADTASAKRFAR